MVRSGKGPAAAMGAFVVVTTRGPAGRAPATRMAACRPRSGARAHDRRRCRPVGDCRCRWDSDAGGFGDLARADAAGADPDVPRPPIDHRPDTLEVRQPPPLGHIVSMRDIATAHRPLAADFTSLRHVRTPSRNPRTGVEFNSTGGFEYQVLGRDSAPIFPFYRAGITRRAGKSLPKFLNERRIAREIITLFETKNDTLIGTVWSGK